MSPSRRSKIFWSSLDSRRKTYRAPSLAAIGKYLKRETQIAKRFNQLTFREVEALRNPSVYLASGEALLYLSH